MTLVVVLTLWALHDRLKGPNVLRVSKERQHARGVGEALERVVRQVTLEAAGVVVELPPGVIRAIDNQKTVGAEVDRHVGKWSAGHTPAASAMGQHWKEMSAF